LPLQYNDFLASDAVIQQLLQLDKKEVAIPIVDGTTLQSAIGLALVLAENIYFFTATPVPTCCS
jgi:hypothetical protein